MKFGNYEIIPPTDFEQALNFAREINKFKTKEMEMVFAKLIKKQLNPAMVIPPLKVNNEKL